MVLIHRRCPTARERTSGFSVAILLSLAAGPEALAQPQYFDLLSRTCSGAALAALNSKRCQTCHNSAPGGESTASATTAVARAFRESNYSASVACGLLAPASSNPSAPTLTLVPPGSRHVFSPGETVTITAIGRDPDGSQVVLTATGLPAGATFDAATGVFRWTPVESTTARVVFTVTDQPNDRTAAKSRSQEVTLTVAANGAPVFDALASPQTLKVGRLFKLRLSAADPDAGGKVKFSFGRDEGGASTKPTGAKLKARPKTRNPPRFNAQFLWKPKPNQVGTHTVRFLATDNDPQPMQAEQVVELRVLP